MLETLHEVTGFSHAVVYLADASLQSLKLRHALPEADNNLVLPDSLPLQGLELTEAVPRLKTASCTNEPQKYPPLRNYLNALQQAGSDANSERNRRLTSQLEMVQTAAVAPIRLEGSFEGLIVLFDTNQTTHDQEVLERYRTFLVMGAQVFGALLDRDLFRTPRRSIALLAAIFAGTVHTLERSMKPLFGPGVDALSDPGLPASVREYASDMVEAARELQANVRDLAQLKRGHLELPVCLDEQIRKAARLAEGKTPAQGARIRLELDLDPGVMIRGSPILLQVALAMLFDNAREGYEGQLPQGAVGSVEVCLRSKAGLATVTITDHGKGIPRADLEKVFHPGYSTKNRGNHSGTGLSAVRAIVSFHKDGRITIKSQQGQFTEVTLEFPSQVATGASADRGTDKEKQT